jgi:hypothetical protein
MNGRAGEISMTGGVWGALCLALAPSLGAAAALAAPAPSTTTAITTTTPISPALVAAAERPAPYPSLAQVPVIPKDVRSGPDWKRAVVATRLAGARVVRIAKAGPWDLSDTEGFAARARAEASPPAPITQPMSATDQALVEAMKRRAIPPPRPR